MDIEFSKGNKAQFNKAWITGIVLEYLTSKKMYSKELIPGSLNNRMIFIIMSINILNK